MELGAGNDGRAGLRILGVRIVDNGHEDFWPLGHDSADVALPD